MAKKILIIDDEIDVMKMLVYRLRAKGFEIYTAVNGESGVNLAKEKIPDLIVLDYRLPDISAVEVSQKLKQEEALKQIPIILITASVDGIELKAKECQAVDFLAKPIDPQDLYEKVEKFISKA